MSAAEQSAFFEVAVSPEQRVVRLRLSGFFTEELMRSLAVEYRRAMGRLNGAKHMVIADMRGMKPLHPAAGAILGEMIAYGRTNGTVLCAHLSNHTVQRLQALRLARENSPADDVTVDVCSVYEAERLLDEARARLEDGRSGTSIRDALAAPVARPHSAPAP